MPITITITIERPRRTMILRVAGSEGGGMKIGVEVGLTLFVGVGDSVGVLVTLGVTVGSGVRVGCGVADGVINTGVTRR
jgi:hypothetical protein